MCRLDSIPLSRPKGQIEKDFADGVLTAEIVKHYFPQIVDLRNYAQARNLQERMSNWRYYIGFIIFLTFFLTIISMFKVIKWKNILTFRFNCARTYNDTA